MFGYYLEKLYLYTQKGMKIVIQRVKHASVTIHQQLKDSIQQGYLILLGVAEGDTSAEVDWLVKKVIGLRVFDDESVSPLGILQERKPPVMDTCCPPRGIYPPL